MAKSGAFTRGEGGRGIFSGIMDGSISGSSVPTRGGTATGASGSFSSKIDSLKSAPDLKPSLQASEDGVDVIFKPAVPAGENRAIGSARPMGDSKIDLSDLFGVAALTMSLKVSVELSSSSTRLKRVLNSSSNSSSSKASGEAASSRVISPMSISRRFSGGGCGCETASDNCSTNRFIVRPIGESLNVSSSVLEAS